MRLSPVFVMILNTNAMLLLPGPEWPSLAFSKHMEPHQKPFTINGQHVVVDGGVQSNSDLEHEVKTAWTVWDGVVTYFVIVNAPAHVP